MSIFIYRKLLLSHFILFRNKLILILILILLQINDKCLNGYIHVHYAYVCINSNSFFIRTY